MLPLFFDEPTRLTSHAAAVRDVESSFTEIFNQAGFKISSTLTHKAAKATGGYPFLIQLVGYFLWREAENHGGEISAQAVDNAINAAGRRNARTVIEAALSTISPKDLAFLNAMAEDNGPSIAGNISVRLNAKTNVTANYRTRLIAAGLIESKGHGQVDFAIPGLRRYLRSQSDLKQE
ncbi:hypothetical protein [Renibacterium salmoninarum]|uniref:hypothetical protein n=1 Tax=Renibacterium salmoninarum TaxID=1646 RepID=UPI001F29E72D|nr:hypothetical protein [Renibacterium salmoninarum]